MSGQDDRRCEKIGRYPDGSTVWKLHGEGGGIFTLPPGILPTFADAKPPTRKLVQRLCVLGTTVSWERDWGHGQKVEFEITADKIVGVRLAEDDE